MLKKKPIDVIIISWWFIIFGTINVYKSLSFNKGNFINKYHAFNILSNIPLNLIIIGNYLLMISAIGFIVGGIGILYLKKWARRSLIIIYITQLIYLFGSFFISSVIITEHIFGFISIRILIGFCIGLLVYSLPFFYLNTNRFKSFLVS